MMKQRIKFFILSTSLLLVVGLAFVNLADYPLTWFDEGSHLHVPKALALFGKYADYSSEGFRFDGPVIGVGPTVMLPVAAVFKLFGIGLFQARLVISAYLIATVIVFFMLSKEFGTWKFAFAATGLLVVTRSTALIEYGRQVLGEVPGLFFLVLGLLLWFKTWNQSSTRRLVVVGVAFGLAMVTKYQYVIVILPALLLALATTFLYHKNMTKRIIVIPAIVAAGVFALWQLISLIYLRPEGFAGNLSGVRASTAGAALVFSPALMQRSISELLNWKTFTGAFLPVLLYSFSLVLPDDHEGHKWFVLLAMISVNLGWYVFASVSWVRYAFPSLALMSLLVAKFFEKLSDGFQFPLGELWDSIRQRKSLAFRHILQCVAIAWIAIASMLPLVYWIIDVANPPANDPQLMADFLEANIPEEAVIETWELEMGFLTDHRYHFPPNGLLVTAIRHIWLSGPPLSEFYDLEDYMGLDYVLVGEFSTWVDLYDVEELLKHSETVTQIGAYLLIRLN
jgi:4-amino-4-deoxy-L-arabinose transferase-like glycosyltransferase